MHALTLEHAQTIGEPRVCLTAGCGKSTLLRLIMRLHDASSGSVLLNGIDVREVSCAGKMDCMITLMAPCHMTHLDHEDARLPVSEPHPSWHAL